MEPVIQGIWVYLTARPLVWLTVTLAAYLIGQWLFERSGRRPLVNPVAIAVLLLVVLLMATGTEYKTYFDGAQFVHFLLGPATVALAVPLHQNFAQVRRAALPMVAALVAGSVTAIVSAVGIAMLFGVSLETSRSLASKSVTMPIAMGITEQIGGIPSLTAVVVMITGVIGAMVVTPLMNLMRIDDWRARGFAVGVASHGIGTARAFQVNEIAGTFAGIAMAMNGIATAILVPLLIALIA
ncbi:membrane protein [Skermanella stibiiresistens SB22]|uniref:Membrane protein n=1 Tax=Skermanella stibiiresistens SB22 TaxID=1385369 RepID=W9H183_9PROT|nr:membrane protein [Skermanella stibiiresistens SB22]